jgi:hypothetical protein
MRHDMNGPADTTMMGIVRSLAAGAGTTAGGAPPPCPPLTPPIPGDQQGPARSRATDVSHQAR